MIEQLSKRIADNLVKNGADASQREVYAYSMECIFNYLLSDLLLYSIGFLIHQLPAIFVWSISYSLLRVHIGGYHASTHARCIISGTIVGLLSLPLNQLRTAFPLSILLLLVILVGNIILFTPVVHERHPVSAQGKKKAKIYAALVTSLGFVLFVVLRHANIALCNSILSGFACALALALLAIIQKLFKHS